MSETQMHELSVTRHIAAPPEVVYRAWTERLAEWWTPPPWTTEVVEQDMRPGGRSALMMRGPRGEGGLMEGVFLEVTPNRRIVSTDAYLAGWIPRQAFMTSVFSFEEENGGTRYTATCRHWTKEAFDQHKEMGFEEGWTTVTGQLAALAEEMAVAA